MPWKQSICETIRITNAVISQKYCRLKIKTAKTETADSLYEAERELSIHQRLEQAQAEKFSQDNRCRIADFLIFNIFGQGGYLLGETDLFENIQN